MDSAKNFVLIFILLFTSISVSANNQIHMMKEIENNFLNNHQKSVIDPIHNKPLIDKATNKQCLACHMEVINKQPRIASLAGVEAQKSLAWYQISSTYKGKQETFHRRHLITEYASKVMNLKCSTCHQGNDAREESNVKVKGTFTIRKMVNPEICQMCHGAPTDIKVMGLPSPWEQSKSLFPGGCLTCHSVIRTNRHNVNYLNAEAIENLAKENTEVCYGCHGGRQWYRIPYKYPRNTWENMPQEVPEWAKDRPTQSAERFTK